MDQISTYFNAERAESILFIAVGIAAIILAAYFMLKVKTPFYSGVSYALITIAMIQLTVGTSVFIRSPKDIQHATEIIQTDKSKIQSEEIPRMNAVMKNFVIYKWNEIALIILGLILFFYFKPMTLWKGIAAGLFIQSVFMLALDFVAENRGKAYLEYLQNI